MNKNSKENKMKTSSIVKFLVVAMVTGLSLTLLVQTSWSYTAGSPNACTGSPADKQSCAQPECHKGSAIFRDGLIKSNIPAEGYTPGTTYTITATAIGSTSATRFGFQLSPQSPTGTLLGTMTVTNSAETKLTGKGKYITQKDMGVTGRAYKSWSFKWTAPAAGTGKVVFYACFLIGGKPEAIFTSKMESAEK
jgi:hypothetical protein